MPRVIPVLRIFNYAKAIAFYVEWLGFRVDWADQPANAPAYAHVLRGGVVLNLTKHHGDCCPGARIRVVNFVNLKAYQRELLAQEDHTNPPGLDAPNRHAQALEMIITDPCGNRLALA